MKTGSESRAALIDTNILVYAYAENSPKRKRAAQLLKDCFEGNIRLAISSQNLGEFCSVSLEKYKLESKEVEETAEELIGCKNFLKLNYREETVLKAVAIQRRYKINFWDAMLAATMLENGIDTIYTEDSGFSRIDGIKAINPFA